MNLNVAHRWIASPISRICIASPACLNFDITCSMNVGKSRKSDSGGWAQHLALVSRLWRKLGAKALEVRSTFSA